MKPLIGITAGLIVNKDHPWAPAVYGQSYTYSDAIIHAGGVPVILPLSHDDTALQNMYERMDGILFAGGNDLDPELYGQQPYAETKDLTPTRDIVELWYMRTALADGKPILGICRGMQLLNVVQGGTLYQHIAKDMPEASNHDISNEKKSITHIAHQLHVDKTSRLGHIIQSDSIGANSHHHQAINKLGESLKAVAWSEDGLTEVIEGTDAAYAIGLQPHPESLEASIEPLWQKVFASFVEACKT